MSSFRPDVRTLFIALVAVAAVAAAGFYIFIARAAKPATAPPAPAAAPAAPTGAKAALTVTAVSAQRAEWPTVSTATGNIAAWQEAVISSEIGGLRLLEVNVNVGDRVTRGQVLARVATETVEADLAQGRAAVAEAKATLAEAQSNAERAEALKASGALSLQQINQYSTAAQTARARLEAAKARLQSDQVRRDQTRIVAHDDGVISARAATVGAVVQNGQELFRLIRKGRLEWRAEVTEAELARLSPGTPARVTVPGGAHAAGKVRMVGPTIDPQTRNGIVYVDLDEPGDLKAGMFGRGDFQLGSSGALSLPQSAVLLRDGFSYVFRLDGEGRVAQVKVTIGRRSGERVEILSGLAEKDRVVASGAGFLNDGDRVRVVEGAVPAPPAPARAVN